MTLLFLDQKGSISAQLVLNNFLAFSQMCGILPVTKVVIRRQTSESLS